MKLERLVSGFCFGEGPRWHQDRLWFSDVIGQTVFRLTADARLDEVVKLEDMPSGLGFLRDGRLVIVGMTSRKLFAWDGSDLTEYADLGEQTPYPINDLVISENDHAYVGGWGYDMLGGADAVNSPLYHLNSETKVTMSSGQLAFPNGCVVLPNQEALIVAESNARRLSKFRINKQGNLSDQELVAEMSDVVPDGICQDEAAGIWVSSPETHCVVRLTLDGARTHQIDCERKPYACALGGRDGRTLFVMTADTIDPATCLANRDAAIECCEAPYRGLRHSGAPL